MRLGERNVPEAMCTVKVETEAKKKKNNVGGMTRIRSKKLSNRKIVGRGRRQVPRESKCRHLKGEMQTCCRVEISKRVEETEQAKEAKGLRNPQKQQSASSQNMIKVVEEKHIVGRKLVR